MKARIIIAAAISALFVTGAVAIEPLKAKPDGQVLEQLNNSRHASQGSESVSSWGEDLPPAKYDGINGKPRLGKEGYVIRGPYRETGEDTYPSTRACVQLVDKELPQMQRHAFSQCVSGFRDGSSHMSDEDMCRACWP